jgi:hypothetical protein
MKPCPFSISISSSLAPAEVHDPWYKKLALAEIEKEDLAPVSASLLVAL